MKERLQKLIARAGIASRRAAEDLISSGEVTVNGQKITELGTKADPDRDHIKVRGKLINELLKARPKTYVLLNKPKGILSAASDPSGRPVVTELIRGLGKLFPVGRLDLNTEGLIILTNDGDFSNHVASSKSIPKVYQVKVKGLPPNAAINKLRRGVRLEDGFVTAPAEIVELPSTEKNGWFAVTLFEGHNQQIRRMFDTIGHSVVKLKRIAIGNLNDAGLKAGAFRKLTDEEVTGLLHFKAARKLKQNAPASPRRASMRPAPSNARKKRKGPIRQKVSRSGRPE